MKTSLSHSSRLRRALTVAVCATALGSSALISAPVASAAAGDVTLAVDVPTSGGGGTVLYADVALGPDGNLWTTNVLSNSISRVAPTGGLATTFVAPTAGGRTTGITAGPDGAMWFAYFGATKIGRIDMSGNFTEYPFPSGTGAYDIAAGPDGNLWFTEIGSTKIGRMSTSGAVTEFDAGVATHYITAGPAGSNKMYFTGAPGTPKVGFISTGGAASLVNTPAGVTGTYGITTSEEKVWFIEATGGASKLAQLVGDTTISETVLTGAMLPVGITAGVQGTTYISDYSGNAVLQLSAAGALQATYPVGVGPVNGVLGGDGNLWFRSDAKLSRMLTAVVPALSTAPAITPASGVTVGTSLTTSNGTWKYAPGSYAYAWQRCTSTDVTTCAAITGASAAQYTASTDDNGKYVRSSVTATNANGASQAAFSALVQVGTNTPPAPPTPPAPAPATGPQASIGSGATATLVVPTTLKRGKSGTIKVNFTVSDVNGAVTFKISKGSKSKTISGVPVAAGAAKTSWKVPSSWPKGSTTVTASFTPAAGSPYQGANVKAPISIK